MNLTKILNPIVAAWKFVASYPALTAGVFQVIIIVATQLGFHLTTDQLASLAGTVAVVFGILVHAGVIPVTKVDNVKAGLKPTLKGQASVLTTPLDPATIVPAVRYTGEPDPENVSPPTRTPFGN